MSEYGAVTDSDDTVTDYGAVTDSDDATTGYDDATTGYDDAVTGYGAVADRGDGGVELEQTGHPAVDAAVRAVVNAADLPVGEQLAAYEGAHETLREVLASIED